jgi:hypoxia up-regulated 1
MCFNITGIAKFAKEMSEKGLGKPKVTLQFELDSSGMCNLIKAEVTTEEMVLVKEVVEVDDDEDTNNATEPTNEINVPDETKASAETAANPEEKTAENANNTTTESKEDIQSNNKTKKESEKLKKKKKKKTKVIEKVSFREGMD